LMIGSAGRKAGKTELACALITRKSYHDMNLNIGKCVWLTFKASAMRVLD